jgi:aminoglycoside phosphotransferase (APT) family kinase protein
MDLSKQQIEAALAHALPGATLRFYEAGASGYTLRLGDGRVLILRVYRGGTAEPAALKLLAQAFEVPAPQLAAFVEHDGPLGAPYALLVPVEGVALEQALPRLSDQERYALGQDLGAIVATVHTRVCPGYGPLGSGQGLPGATSDRDYALVRLEAAIEGLGRALGAATAKNLRRWFDESVVETGRGAQLCHGALDLRNVLVRRGEERWTISGLVGWGAAVAWRPAWDHALLLENVARADAFSLRVGYGEGYEATNERAYDQLREHALAPFRLILYLERAAAAPAEAMRYLRLVEAMLAALLAPPGDDERFDTALTA